MVPIGGAGLGLSDNVVAAYNFICLNYEAKVDDHGKLDEEKSDELFLFGFSRGAYTARALAGLVSTVGIMKKAYLKDFPAIYKEYQKRNAMIPGLTPNQFKVTAENVRIKLVGVWDTVGSLGVPDTWFTPTGFREMINKGVSFHDTDISSRQSTRKITNDDVYAYS